MENLLSYGILETSDLFEEVSMVRFNGSYLINLYGVVDESVSHNMQLGSIKNLTLYESSQAAIKTAKNIKNPVLAGFTVDMQGYENDWIYDEFEFNMAEYIKKKGLKKEDYQKRCGLIRTLEKIDGRPIIVFKVNNLKRIKNFIGQKKLQYEKQRN